MKGLFRQHYVSWSEQQRIEDAAPSYLRNVGRIITETRLRIYKELAPTKKDQLDHENKVVWIPDSKTPNRVAEVSLTDLAAEAFRDQIQLAGTSSYLFPSADNETGHQTTFKTAWRLTLKRAKVPYFRIYDLRSTYATRPSAGGVADEWVTQLLRRGDAKLFKKYSQMKWQMKREALQNSIARRKSRREFWNRRADEFEVFWDGRSEVWDSLRPESEGREEANRRDCSKIGDLEVGA